MARIYSASALGTRARAAPRGIHRKPAATDSSPSINVSPAAQRHSRLLRGETSARTPKYRAVSGVVNTSAPMVAEKLAASRWKPLPRGRSPASSFISFGVSHKRPATAAKDICRLTDAAAKGLTSRIRNSAAARAVGGSPSRSNSGAAIRNASMTQARTTEGLAPVSRA